MGEWGWAVNLGTLLVGLITLGVGGLIRFTRLELRSDQLREVVTEHVKEDADRFKAIESDREFLRQRDHEVRTALTALVEVNHSRLDERLRLLEQERAVREDRERRKP